MSSRFKVPGWVRKHNFKDGDWKQASASELDRIKAGLSKFHVNQPVVSVVIPVWNEEKNLLRTLSSFSAMELKYPTELIIVNNNSTDSTQALLDRLGVRSLLETKQGIAHARLAGLKASKGKYQLCGDGDSLYPPHWVETLAKPLMDNEKITCVYANYSFLPFGKAGRIQLGFYELLAEVLFEYRRIRREFLNVRGANFGFRIEQGLAVKGFEMPV
ncbi:MAG: glycosyltransferase family A protein, partial [Imperialibacter sp.]